MFFFGSVNITNDIKIYKIIITKTAFNENRINNIKEIVNNKNTGILFLSFKCFIFIENIGNFETRR